MNGRTPTFIIEGNIGAGKSTFVSLIQNSLDVHVVYEPHDQWQAVGGTHNLLEQFYTHTERWAYTFQTYAFVSRVRAQQEHMQRYPYQPQVVERSVYSDRYCFAKNCFELGYMNMLEWKLYQEWFAWLVENYTQVPDGFIYLRAEPELCYKRLQKRDRKEEACVPFAYLQSLHAKHENWLMKKEGIADNLKHIPVLTIDANQEFAFDDEVKQKVLNEVQSFIQANAFYQEAVIKRDAMVL